MSVVLRRTEAAVEFLWWVGWWWWGLQSHFRVQPNNCVQVVLRCVVVGVLTKSTTCSVLWEVILYGRFDDLLPSEIRDWRNANQLLNNAMPHHCARASKEMYICCSNVSYLSTTMSIWYHNPKYPGSKLEFVRCGPVEKQALILLGCLWNFS